MKLLPAVCWWSVVSIPYGAIRWIYGVTEPFKAIAKVGFNPLRGNPVDLRQLFSFPARSHTGFNPLRGNPVDLLCAPRLTS